MILVGIGASLKEKVHYESVRQELTTRVISKGLKA